MLSFFVYNFSWWEKSAKK